MKKCKYCNKDFEPKNPKGKFCSDRCRVYFGRREKSLQAKGFKNGDTVLHGIATLDEKGNKSAVILKEPIVLIKAPKNLAELKELCPFKENGDERSAWIAKNRQKYSI